MKKGGLKRWHSEKWQLADGSECGSNKDKNNPGKCRPSVRVNEDTPKTWGELSESEKARAKRDKAQANKKNQQFGKLRFMMKRKNKD